MPLTSFLNLSYFSLDVSVLNSYFAKTNIRQTNKTLNDFSPQAIVFTRKVGLHIPLDGLNEKDKTIPSVGKEREKVEFSNLAVGRLNGYNHFESRFGHDLLKRKCTYIHCGAASPLLKVDGL